MWPNSDASSCFDGRSTPQPSFPLSPLAQPRSERVRRRRFRLTHHFSGSLLNSEIVICSAFGFQVTTGLWFAVENSGVAMKRFALNMLPLISKLCKTHLHVTPTLCNAVNLYVV